MTRPNVVGLDLSITAPGLAHTGVDGIACTHLIKPTGAGDLRLYSIRNQILALVEGSELVLTGRRPGPGSA